MDKKTYISPISEIVAINGLHNILDVIGWGGSGNEPEEGDAKNFIDDEDLVNDTNIDWWK